MLKTETIRKFLSKINLRILYLILTITIILAVFTFLGSISYQYQDVSELFYGFFYIIASLLSVISAIRLKNITPKFVTILVFSIIWLFINYLVFFCTLDLVVTPSFMLFFVTFLAFLWSYIAYFSFYKPKKQRPVIGHLGFFIILYLLTGWFAWASGNRILYNRHARVLLDSRQKAMKIVDQIKEYKANHDKFPQSLNEMNLPKDLTDLQLMEFEYDSVGNIHFSLSFRDVLHYSIHYPDFYEYEYVKINEERTIDEWRPDPLVTIQYLSPSLIPEINRKKLKSPKDFNNGSPGQGRRPQPGENESPPSTRDTGGIEQPALYTPSPI